MLRASYRFRQRDVGIFLEFYFLCAAQEANPFAETAEEDDRDRHQEEARDDDVHLKVELLRSPFLHLRVRATGGELGAEGLCRGDEAHLGIGIEDLDVTRGEGGGHEKHQRYRGHGKVTRLAHLNK